MGGASGSFYRLPRKLKEQGVADGDLREFEELVDCNMG